MDAALGLIQLRRDWMQLAPCPKIRSIAGIAFVVLGLERDCVRRDVALELRLPWADIVKGLGPFQAIAAA